MGDIVHGILQNQALVSGAMGWFIAQALKTPRMMPASAASTVLIRTEVCTACTRFCGSRPIAV